MRCDLRLISSCLALGLVLGLALAPQPGWAADADNGSRLAHRWCEACHIVTPTQHRAGSDMAPPFATIAKRPGNSASRIALFLLDPHPKMPDMSLSRSEAADLAAYITSLAR
jgi:mono/diheme cytochrome c family protein